MTNSQKRGYIVLTALLMLSVAILSIVQWHHDSSQKAKKSHSLEEDEQLAIIGDTLMFRSYREDSIRRAAYRKPHYPSQKRYYQHYKDSTNSGSYPKDSSLRQHYPHRKTERLVLDINEADTLAFQQLKGIGPVFSNRIVKYRNLLGGFVRKEQLMEVYGITSELYAQVESQLRINEPLVRQMDLNTATLNELKSHPYLDYYQAKAIVSFRQKNPFTTVEDLKKVTLIDATTFEKLRPYIIIK